MRTLFDTYFCLFCLRKPKHTLVSLAPLVLLASLVLRSVLRLMNCVNVIGVLASHPPAAAKVLD